MTCQSKTLVELMGEELNELLRSAYQKLAFALHPDRGHNFALAEEAFEVVSAAFAQLQETQASIHTTRGSKPVNDKRNINGGKPLLSADLKKPHSCEFTYTVEDRYKSAKETWGKATTSRTRTGTRTTTQQRTSCCSPLSKVILSDPDEEKKDEAREVYPIVRAHNS
ncbi:hypothetical protein CYMTET_8945 [Cymbomonas tetramitiformis]|uniref:J domain-containing protein n=1 Tax=Cymbomonas tetramitiformis TaxID=36881 RepID=A0AAE0LG00_9CHLO|nr:hypothetical protein CYMTET_48372 [Cymbomonas tetramitiformis]KAK3283355.1 hypothetical protein CYMTET_8945 [Cymbomonas tetramitiformis]